MDIRQRDKQGALEILKSLTLKEQLDFKNNEYRKTLKFKDLLVLYINDIPISFLEIYKLSERDNYVISITKEEFRGSDEVYNFRKIILNKLTCN